MTSVSILKSRHQAQKLLSKQFPVVVWCSVTSNTLKEFTTERGYSLLRLRTNVQAHTTRYISTYHKTTEDYRGRTKAKSVEIHPIQMMRILRDAFHNPQTIHKYAKHLDKKVQVDSSVSPEPEIISNPESAEDTRC